ATGNKATAGSGKLSYHKIKNGETLSTIAARYRVSVNDIKRWNGLRNNQIIAGKQLKIYK
ncbi:LysM peptidoglycan-binding domain-containing protein, partial [Bacteroides sp. OttesenSCG-928-D19]|nr:LysM peptidoglycan-binding domain-containing protein [Bacteroides sp. OttesenSCG-928-D19]